MNSRPSSLIYIALATLGLSGLASAQLTVNLPTVDFYDPLNVAPTQGDPNPVNQIYTANATSTFFLSASVNQLTGGTMARFNPLLSGTSTCGFRMRNSAYPGVWADFSLLNGTWAAPIDTTNEGTAAVTASTRSAFGPLISATIQSGSTMAFEAYNSHTLGALSNMVEVTGTNIGFTLNAATFTSTVQSTFAFPGTFVGVTTGSATSLSTFTATQGGSQFILTNQVRTNSLTMTNFSTANQFGDIRITGTNSAYPGLFVTFSPWSSGGGYLMGAGNTRSYAGISGNASNTLVGAIINPGTTWTWIVSDSSDGETDNVPDFDASNISFSITGTSFTSTYDSGVVAGPINAGGSVGSVQNGVITLPAVGSAFVMGTGIIFEGTATQVLSNSQASDLRIRLRNSAYPTFFTTEFQPTSASFSGGVVNVSAFQINSPSPRDQFQNRVASTLRGLNIPAGSTFSAEFYDINDNGAGADAIWTNVRIRMQIGTAWGPTGAPTPATFTDLGTITNANATTSNALSGTSPAITSGGVSWFKLTVPSNVDGSIGQYINFYVSSAASTGALSDSVMSVFDNSGRHLFYDDDSGAGLFSMLTAGAPGAGTPYAVNAISGEESFSGKDAGGLPAGTYWIAVAPYSNTGSLADGFNVVSGSTSAFPNGVRLNVISNLGPAPLMGSQLLTGTMNLGDVTTFGEGLNRYISYVVRQDGDVVGGGMITHSSAAQTFEVNLPSDLNGPATIEFNGSSFLARTMSVELSGANQPIQSITLQNGDVDGSGEVDAADIDEVIAHFGEQWPGGFGNIDADVDVSGEVDAADIDIVIANFGGADN